MALSFGTNLTSAYVVTSANSTLWRDRILKDARRSSSITIAACSLVYSVFDGGGATLSSGNVTAVRFPFDFTVSLPMNAARFNWTLYGIGGPGSGGEFETALLGINVFS
jgi:hypothetical protein